MKVVTHIQGSRESAASSNAALGALLPHSDIVAGVCRAHRRAAVHSDRLRVTCVVSHY